MTATARPGADEADGFASEQVGGAGAPGEAAKVAGRFGLQGEQLGDDRTESLASEAAFVAGGVATVETPDTALAGGQQRPVLGAKAQMGGVVGGGGAGDSCGGSDRVARIDIAVGFFGQVDQVPQGVEVLREPFGL